MSDQANVTYVAGYDDPEADMILKSKDGSLFRVHSYYLKSNRFVGTSRRSSLSSTDSRLSAFFRSMATPDQLGDRSPHPAFEIEGTASALSNLLNQVTLPTPPYISDWATAHPVIQLGERYQFDHLHSILAQSIQNCRQTHPMEVFIYASQHDLEQLAKLSVESLPNSSDWRLRRIREIRESHFVGAKVSYTVALVRAMRVGEKQGSEYIDWGTAARAFVIVR